MDRNFILAIALFYIVLVTYQSVFTPPKHVQQEKTTQTVENNKDTSKQATALVGSAKSIQVPTKQDFKEEITSIKTTNTLFEFSNVGGSLHNIGFSANDKSVPLVDVLSIGRFSESAFNLIEKTDSRLVYAFEDKQWKVIKQFDIENNKIKAQFRIINKMQTSSLEDLNFVLLKFDHNKIEDKTSRNAMLDEVSILEGKKVFRKGVANKFGPKDNRVEKGSAGWFGFRDHFHAIVVKPEFETKQYENEVVNENVLSMNVKPKQAEESYNFTLIAGNQDIQWFKGYGQEFYKIVVFSNWWILDWPAKAVYYTVPFLHSICKSWGFSIILVSLLIYGITYPLTKQSMSAMKKMQLVQPKVAALQKRYKDDPAKLNSEMIDLYRREGVNPLGGCLPFLLQMPVFIALYQALWRSYYFQGKSFLWIKDLSQPDRLMSLPFSIPFLGSDLNILPIMMGIVMFIQQMITSKNMVVTDETQAMQQKMMKYIFPFFIGFIFYKFASGLSLYFTVFYALSAWAQWKVSKSK